MMLRFAVLEKAHSTAVQGLTKKYLIPSHLKMWNTSDVSPILRKREEIFSDLSDVVNSYIEKKVSLVCLNRNNEVVGTCLNLVMNSQDDYRKYFVNPFLPIKGEPEDQAKIAESLCNHSKDTDLFKDYQTKRLVYLYHGIVVPEYRGNLPCLNGDSINRRFFLEVEKRFCENGDIIFADGVPANNEHGFAAIKRNSVAMGFQVIKSTPIPVSGIMQMRVCKQVLRK